ncbi:MAG: hypothetical protein ACAI43_11270 [Phycisphaerae bacterium]|nr:hypothetical protein [Tepidisphaeraceae bacterium]
MRCPPKPGATTAAYTDQWSDMKRMIAIVVTLAVVLTATPSSAQPRKPLRGIDKVIVVVTVDGDAKPADGDLAGFKEKVEGRLRKAGVKLGTPADARLLVPKLVVSVEATKRDGEDSYLYAVQAVVMEIVTMERLGEVHLAMTWTASGYGIVPKADLGTIDVTRVVDKFLKQLAKDNE